MSNEIYSNQLMYKPLSFELYLNFVNELFLSPYVGWFINDSDNLLWNYYQTEETISHVQASFSLVKNSYYSVMKDKYDELNEVQDVKETHEEIIFIFDNIEKQLYFMKHDIEKFSCIEENTMDNFEKMINTFTDKKDELINMKDDFDNNFRFSFNWDEQAYYNFYVYLINKSDFKQLQVLMSKIIEIFREKIFTDQSLNYISLIDESLSELITFYDKISIDTSYRLGNEWFEMDKIIRTNLILLKKDVTLVQFIYKKDGITENLLNILQKLAENYSFMLDTITNFFSEYE